MEHQRQHPTGGEQKPDQPTVNSYGTDDPELQAHIENARIDAARERDSDRARLERYVELGMRPDDAEAVIEFEHSIEDQRRQAAQTEQADDR